MVAELFADGMLCQTQQWQRDRERLKLLRGINRVTVERSN